MEANRLFVLANTAQFRLDLLAVASERAQNAGLWDRRGTGAPFHSDLGISTNGTAQISPYHAPRCALILPAGSLHFLAGESPAQAKNRA
jgi:hypothetical protein